MTNLFRSWVCHLAGGSLALAVVASSCRRAPVSTETPVPAAAEAAGDVLELKTVSDPAVVFQRALWRRPVAGDRIEHAERREWSHSSDGVAKWQWFLVFEPAPETREWLATNPFELAVVSSVAWPEGKSSVPEWFPRDLSGWEIRQKVGGGLTMLQSPDGRRVVAMDEGFGFSGGVKVQ